MAKKYKLIRTYPDSPELGFIAEFTEGMVEVVYSQDTNHPKYDLVDIFISLESCKK